MSLHVLVATAGRNSLINLLLSMINQLKEEDFLTIVFDGPKKEREIIRQVNELVPHFLAQVNIIEEEENLGYWGHGIRNKHNDLSGDFILHADDDDMYLPNAMDEIRKTCTDKDTLYIFAIIAKGNKLVFNDKGIAICKISTQSGVIPRELNKQGRWAYKYGGDYDFYQMIGKKAKKIVYNSTPIYLMTPGPTHIAELQKNRPPPPPPPPIVISTPVVEEKAPVIEEKAVVPAPAEGTSTQLVQENDQSIPKIGILCYDTLNIGDEIQSIAMKKLIESFGYKVKYYVLRDRMDLVYDQNYQPVKTSTLKDGEIVLFMNGWFAHPHNARGNEYLFPPPSFIKPIFLSMHMTDDFIRRVVDRNLDYFKSRGPIGCRDQPTFDKLKRRGIEVRFDGCITLSLDRFNHEPSENTICYIDLPGHWKRDHPQKKEVRLGHIDRNTRSLATRFADAEKLLVKYQKADKIYTTRLHGYLPCKAMGLNAEFINTLPGDHRFIGLIDQTDDYYRERKQELRKLVEEILRNL